MSAVELLCSAALVLPAVVGSLAVLAPIAAACIGGEMRIFCGLQLSPARGAPGS